MGQDKERLEVADFIVEHAEKGGTVIYSREKYGDGRPRDTIAAFTTPGEMLAWLAGQYRTLVSVDPGELVNSPAAKSSLGERIVPPAAAGTPTYVRDIPEAAGRAASQFMGVTFVPTVEPGYHWPSREALFHTLVRAFVLCMDQPGIYRSPTDRAKTLIDKIDEIVGEGTGK